MAASGTKNGYIELQRFIAAVAILLFHTEIIAAGWIFVEFFYMLIGFFAMKHMQDAAKQGRRLGNAYPFEYTWKRFKKLFPYTTISILMMCVFKAYTWHLGAKGLFKWIITLPGNLLHLWGFGVLPAEYEVQEGIFAPDPLMNPYLWFISSMLVALIFYIFLIQHSKKTRVLIFGILPLFLYGFLIAMDGTVTGWHHPKLGWLECDMRALAGILLGGAAWYAGIWLKKFTYTNAKRAALTAAEVAALVAAFVLACTLEVQLDIVNILLFFVAVTLSASEVTYTSVIRGKFFTFLGALSMPIYCMQLVVIVVCNQWFPQLNGWIVTILVIVFSIICYLVINTIKNSIDRSKQSNRKIRA